jgi:5-methylcytosine-specific restriction endonuclease McrA
MVRRYRGSTRAYRKARAAVLAYATHCHLCGKTARPWDPFVVDHVVPRALGGPDIISNLRAAHRSCNARRGAKPLPQAWWQ